jgi:opacity protein-like surface antigen
MVKSLCALVAAASLVPFVATAQTTAEPSPSTNQPATDQSNQQMNNPPMTDQSTMTTTQQQSTTTYVNPQEFREKAGWSVGLWADTGVSSYTNQLANATDIGVAYGGRVDFSPVRNLGFEIGYDGSLNNLKSSISSNGSLYGNAATGDFRLNFVPPNFDIPVRPYIFGGVGYQNVTPTKFTPGFSDANLLAVPVGAGLEADVAGGFLIGARFTWNFLFNEQGPLAGKATDVWGAVADIGARFK